MQNLDFTVIHMPGKSNMADDMSRHPSPDTSSPRHEKYVKAVIEADHAIVLDTIREKTKKDKEPRKLTAVLKNGTWDIRDEDLRPYCDFRSEIYEADGVILRFNRIIPSNAPRLSLLLTSKVT